MIKQMLIGFTLALTTQFAFAEQKKYSVHFPLCTEDSPHYAIITLDFSKNEKTVKIVDFEFNPNFAFEDLKEENMSFGELPAANPGALLAIALFGGNRPVDWQAIRHSSFEAHQYKAGYDKLVLNQKLRGLKLKKKHSVDFAYNPKSKVKKISSQDCLSFGDYPPGSSHQNDPIDSQLSVDLEKEQASSQYDWELKISYSETYSLRGNSERIRKLAGNPEIQSITPEQAYFLKALPAN